MKQSKSMRSCDYRQSACAWHRRCHCLYRVGSKGSENTPFCIDRVRGGKCPENRKETRDSGMNTIKKRENRKKKCNQCFYSLKNNPCSACKKRIEGTGCNDCVREMCSYCDPFTLSNWKAQETTEGE